MNRWKNYGLWVAVAAFILLVLQTVGVEVVPDRYNELVNSLLTILVLAGIINNPSIGTGYKDGEK
ncbi:MAG: holin [Bacillus sp. (in: firmicutes)]